MVKKHMRSSHKEMEMVVNEALRKRDVSKMAVRGVNPAASEARPTLSPRACSHAARRVAPGGACTRSAPVLTATRAV